MKKTIIAVTLATAITSAPALAQLAGPRVGMTRDGALAQAGKQFGRLDQNGDGSFDNAEATALLQMRAQRQGKTFDPQLAAQLVSRNDGNGDGKVTLAEYQAAAGARFDQIDTNKNGTIDDSEGNAAAANAAAGE